MAAIPSVRWKPRTSRGLNSPAYLPCIEFEEYIMVADEGLYLDGIAKRVASYNPNWSKTIVDDLRAAGEDAQIIHRGTAYRLEGDVIFINGRSSSADALHAHIEERIGMLEQWANISVEEAGMGEGDETLLEHYNVMLENGQPDESTIAFPSDEHPEGAQLIADLAAGYGVDDSVSIVDHLRQASVLTSIEYGDVYFQLRDGWIIAETAKMRVSSPAPMVEAAIAKQRGIAHAEPEAAPAPVADQAAPINAFDLSSVMAATAKAIDDGRTVPGGPTGTTSAAPAVATVPTAQTAPTFRKGPDFAAAPKPQAVQADASTDARSSLPFPQRRGPDFTTAPAPKKKPEDEKLTSQMVIIQLNDFDTKPKLATDEIARRGAGVAVSRKAYRIDGTEIKASYEFAKGGKVLHTGYDGKQTEMTFEQAKRHEIAEINLLNRNAIIAINKMSTDPTFTLRQGDATFSVKGNFFVRTKDDGTVTKEPLAETQKRFTERSREIRAMGGPELDPKPPTNAMQAVQPKPEKTQRFARMADRADAAAAHENKSGKTLESGNQLGA
ncbi:hypothetical protein [Rhizobium leguminosarum]|uniref:hypothetical protein n=1 Tax=Rhizobium leguminosarum TaxID=384 RepID=UPI0013BAA36B|nr:hypothetical protein [Rhizobium leguminosarum]NEI66573.1 hypothetical protein [Rhizobium leguminosarum]